MKKPSPKLHELIKSMTKSEKRYFKQYTKIHGKNKKYVQLFDAIEQQQDYDEETLRKNFEDTGAIRHLSSAKNYLYQLILKALNACYSDIGVETELLEYRKSIDVLMLKGLYEQALHLINKARKKCEEHDKKDHNLHFLRRKIDLHTYRWEFDKVEELEHQYINEKNAYNRSTDIEDYFRQLNLSLNQKITRYHIVRQENVKKEIEELANCEIEQQEPVHASLSARLSYLSFWSAYYYLKGDIDQTLAFNQRALQLYEDHPSYKKENIKRYIRHVSNEILLFTRYNDHAKQRELLNWASQIENEMPIIKRFPELSYELFKTTEKVNLILFIDEGNFEQAAGQWQSIQQKLANYGDIATSLDKMEFMAMASEIFFGIEDYETSLHFVTKIQKEFDNADIRYDLLSYLKIMELIIHYELNNQLLIGNKIAATYRYLNKKENLLQAERVLMDFLSRTPDMISTQDVLANLRQLREHIIALQNDPMEQLMLSNFDYVAWIDSKLQNRPFAEIVREKAAQPYHS